MSTGSVVFRYHVAKRLKIDKMSERVKKMKSDFPMAAKAPIYYILMYMKPKHQKKQQKAPFMRSKKWLRFGTHFLGQKRVFPIQIEQSTRRHSRYKNNTRSPQPTPC